MAETNSPPIMKGVNAAVVTPMNKDLSADIGLLYAHCTWLLENGCDGLGILGSTGEANSFSARERIDIIQGLAKAGLPMEKTMPGTGSSAFTDTVDVTRCAMDVGAGGVLMLPPFFYSDVSDDGIYNAFAEIIHRVDAQRLRVYLYHIPKFSGVPISHDLIARLIADFPETVVGLKDSNGIVENMLEMIKKFPGFAIFTGADEMFLDILQAGGAGCITANSNFASSLMQKIYSSWIDKGEIDNASNDTVRQIRSLALQYPFVEAVKSIMADHSGTTSWLNIRPPFTLLDETDKATLIAEIKSTGYIIPPIR